MRSTVKDVELSPEDEHLPRRVNREDQEVAVYECSRCGLVYADFLELKLPLSGRKPRKGSKRPPRYLRLVLWPRRQASEDVEYLQKDLGVEQDGRWGPKLAERSRAVQLTGKCLEDVALDAVRAVHEL